MNNPIILQKPDPLSFIDKMSRYEVQDTNDGNWTLYSKDFKEASHSIHGPYLETVNCYFELTTVLDFMLQQDSIHILEVGFGAGLAFEYFRYYLYDLFMQNKLEKNKICKTIYYTGLELDSGLLEWRIKNIKNLLVPTDFGNFIDLRIIQGDARKTINQMIGKKTVDIIFQDAFCLKTCPELWTIEWFKQLSLLAKKGSKLGTFSASTQVKRALENVGWSTYEGAAFHRKKGPILGIYN